jgi:hypothetical protein
LYGDTLEGRSGPFILPMLIGRAGTPNIKFGAQLGVPWLLNDPDWEINFYDHVMVLFTVSYRYFHKN